MATAKTTTKKTASKSTKKKDTFDINAETIKKAGAKVADEVKKQAKKAEKKAKEKIKDTKFDETVETVKVEGQNLIEKVKELIKEGNVRKITIIDKEGKRIATFPLTFGILGTVIAPVLAAIGAIAALVTECTIRIERK